MPTNVSKRTRFELFKRDDFTCQYCGRKPPQVVLHADHITPKSKQGHSTIDNLVTSCLDCNLGKSNIPLSSIPETLQNKLERMKEQQAQLRAFDRFQAQIEQARVGDIEEIGTAFTSLFPNQEFTERFKQLTLRRFLEHLSKHEIVQALRDAAGTMASRHKKRDLPDETIRYFCGICWKKIRGGGTNG